MNGISILLVRLLLAFFLFAAVVLRRPLVRRLRESHKLASKALRVLLFIYAGGCVWRLVLMSTGQVDEPHLRYIEKGLLVIAFLYAGLLFCIPFADGWDRRIRAMLAQHMPTLLALAIPGVVCSIVLAVCVFLITLGPPDHDLDKLNLANVLLSQADAVLKPADAQWTAVQVQRGANADSALTRAVDRLIGTPIPEARDYIAKARATIAAAMKEVGPGSTLEEVGIALIALIGTIAGVVLAIYSIKGYLDHPRNVFDVVKRLQAIIGRMVKNGRPGFILFLGQYPALGASSYVEKGKSPAFSSKQQEYYELYEPMLRTIYKGANFRNSWHVSVVCPKGSANDRRAPFVIAEDIKKEWGEHGTNLAKRWDAIQRDKEYGSMTLEIFRYADSMGFTPVKKWLDAALLNIAVTEQLRKVLAGRFCWNWGKPDSGWAGGYFAVVLGAVDVDERGGITRVVPEEAIVLFATDIPELEKPVTSISKNYVKKLVERRQKRTGGFPLRAWQFTDREGIADIMAEAVKAADVKKELDLFVVQKDREARKPDTWLGRFVGDTWTDGPPKGQRVQR